mmetsp:Transcript_3898/g.14376  ORF Transcript_3898/g.14376 Transcript_3898/m.14376 type:complete len:393 (-) Transcript_3898:593-1771(-)
MTLWSENSNETLEAFVENAARRPPGRVETRAFSINSFPTRSGPYPCAPVTGTLGVTQFVVRVVIVWSTSAATAIAASTACSAIKRYVVHFPPVTVTTPSFSSCTTWSLLTFSVLPPSPSPAFGALANGRMPLHADVTSFRVAGLCKYGATASKMKSTSSLVGFGVSVIGATTSVVPANKPPSQGNTNTTRPSFVFGIIKPKSVGAKCEGNTTCVPPAGVMMGALFSSPIARTESVNGPVQLSTALACTVNGLEPLFSKSRTTTPTTRFCLGFFWSRAGFPDPEAGFPDPEDPKDSLVSSAKTNFSTRIPFATTAPALAAVVASATASLASSNCPSWYTIVPFRDDWIFSSSRVYFKFGNATRLSLAFRNFDIGNELLPLAAATKSYAFIPAQ